MNENQKIPMWKNIFLKSVRDWGKNQSWEINRWRAACRFCSAYGGYQLGKEKISGCSICRRITRSKAGYLFEVPEENIELLWEFIHKYL